MNRTEMKTKAQDYLMDGVGNVLGYWYEKDPDFTNSLSEEEATQFREILKREADRIAKLFGFSSAWSN